MNLDELRTPHPLRDADFAAIRARVKAEIAQREERGWLTLLLRFAFAAALVVAFVPFMQERLPRVERAVIRPRLESGVRRGVAEVQPAPQIATHNPQPATGNRQPSTPNSERQKHRRVRTTPTLIAQDVTPAITRIEIQTADPTIRIIWLTQPKENS